MGERVDYLVLAPLTLEINALLEELRATTVERRTYRDEGTDYWPHQFTINRDGARSTVTVHIVQLKEQGVLQAAITTTRLLYQLRPVCVVSFGIAGGFISDEVKLGNVVVATSVSYYKPAKEGKRAKKGKSDKKLARRFARTKPFTNVDEQLVNKCREIRNPFREKGRKLRFGPIASGEKLVAYIDAPAYDIILELNDKMLAVEMEAAGVAAAVRDGQATHPCRLLVLKGISDDVKHKYKTKKGEYRTRAARNAAQLLARVIQEAELEHHEIMVPLHLIDIWERAKNLRGSLKRCWLHKPFREVEAARVLSPGDHPTPLFYHLRLDHPHVHWVDFHFLLILKRLMRVGLSVNLLVTDEDAKIGLKGRPNTEHIVKLVLGME